MTQRRSPSPIRTPRRRSQIQILWSYRSPCLSFFSVPFQPVSPQKKRHLRTLLRRKVPAFSGRSAAIHGVAVCSIVVPRHCRGPPLKAFPKILSHYITGPGKSQRGIFLFYRTPPLRGSAEHGMVLAKPAPWGGESSAKGGKGHDGHPDKRSHVQPVLRQGNRRLRWCERGVIIFSKSLFKISVAVVIVE